jgi:glycopeptide antibiotics resistance protein
MFLQSIAGLSTIWFLVILGLIGIASLLAFTEPSEDSSAIRIISDWFGPVTFWTIGLNLIWFIPFITWIPFYYKTIEYSVKAESDETCLKYT